MFETGDTDAAAAILEKHCCDGIRVVKNWLREMK